MSKQNNSSLPDNWATIPLKDITSKIVDGSHNPPRKQNNGMPMLSARNINNNQINFDNYRLISEKDFEHEHNRTRITPGDVLLTIVGTIGRSAMVPAHIKPFTLQRSVAVLTFKDIVPKYMMYQLQSPFFQRHFNKVAKGTAQKGVYLRTLGQSIARIAPLNEQKRIVAEIEKQFFRLDEAVDNLKRVKANLKRYKASVLKAAVEGKLINTIKENICFKVEKLEPVESALFSLDQGWSPKCDRQQANESEWGVIKTSAVQTLQYIELKNKRLPESLDPRQHLELQRNDLLVTRAGPRKRVGICCLVRFTRPKLILCDKVYRLRCNHNVARAGYLELVLNAPQIKEAINKLKTGISDSGVNLTQKRFKALRIPLPSVELQMQIESEVQRLWSIADSATLSTAEGSARCQRLRQSILKKAFSGKLFQKTNHRIISHG